MASSDLRKLEQARLLVAKYIPMLIPTQCRYDFDLGEFIHGSFAVSGANYRMQIHRAFYDRLVTEEVAYILAHEYLHKLLFHCDPRRSNWMRERNPAAFSVSIDIVVNNIVDELIAENGCPIRRPMLGTFDDSKKGMSVEQVFLEVDKHVKTTYVTFDDHGNLIAASDNLDEDTVKILSDLARGASMQNAMRLRNGMSMGTGSSALDLLLEDIRKPPKHWVEFVYDFLRRGQGEDDVTWKRFHRKLNAAVDLYMPTLEGSTLGKGALGVDVSGSMPDDEVSLVFGAISQLSAEFDHIEGISVVQWDDAIVGVRSYTQMDLPLDKVEQRRKGSGGTDANHFLHWLNENAEEQEIQWAICVTDGHVPAVDTPTDIPVLWLVTQASAIEGVHSQDILRIES